MRVSTVCLLAVVAAASASVLPNFSKDHRIADEKFLYRQRYVLELLNHIYEPYSYPDQQNVVAEFDFEKYGSKFTNKKALSEFQQLYEIGFLPKGYVFSVFYEKQRQQAIALFNLFYYAEDFETFYQVARWARDHLNEGIFVYSFTVAVLHRRDTRGIVLPAIYEIYPYFFLNNDAINKAFYVKLQKGIYDESQLKNYGIQVQDNVYTFNFNNSGWYLRNNYEQRISYFTEDIGLNAYYYYFNADYPSWLGGSEFGLGEDKRGELFYYFHQQLLARYYLERLSNGLGPIARFSWYQPIKTGYYNSLRYSNGLSFPSRPNNYYIWTDDKVDQLQIVEGFERRLQEAIFRGYVELPNGEKLYFKNPEDINNLGNWVQNNPDAKYQYHHYVFAFARSLLGGGYDPIDEYKLIPSALEQYETTLRDPVFWQLSKRFIKYFTEFKHALPAYTKDDLFFPGVTIENVEVEKLFTFFDKFDWEFTNAIWKNAEEFKSQKEQFIFRARQERLNHQPFNVKIGINSEEEVKSVIRIFIGPKYDSFNNLYKLEDNQYNFVELDTFVYDLKKGKNIIDRYSRDFYNVVQDRTSARDLYKHVLASIDKTEQFNLDRSEAHFGFPARLLLPKGSRGGFPYQFYVIASPWVAPKIEYGTGFDPIVYSGVGTGARYLDGRALGYPFDRRIDSTYFSQPNSFWKDVSIYHKYNYEPSSKNVV